MRAAACHPGVPAPDSGAHAPRCQGRHGPGLRIRAPRASPRTPQLRDAWLWSSRLSPQPDPLTSHVEKSCRFGTSGLSSAPKQRSKRHPSPPPTPLPNQTPFPAAGFPCQVRDASASAVWTRGTLPKGESRRWSKAPDFTVPRPDTRPRPATPRSDAFPGAAGGLACPRLTRRLRPAGHRPGRSAMASPAHQGTTPAVAGHHPFTPDRRHGASAYEGEAGAASLSEPSLWSHKITATLSWWSSGHREAGGPRGLTGRTATSHCEQARCWVAEAGDNACHLAPPRAFHGTVSLPRLRSSEGPPLPPLLLHAHARVRTHTHAHVHTNTRTHAPTRARAHIRTHTHRHTCTYMHACAHRHIHTHLKP